ncbi:MAG: TIM barrel protein [Chitinivibrionales bacterium]|nr:TIM barrel protein [Chitinivibrionales bacterium]
MRLGGRRRLGTDHRRADRNRPAERNHRPRPRLFTRKHRQPERNRRMRTSINGTVWSSLSKATGQEYPWRDRVRHAAEAGYDGIEMGGTEKSLGKAADVRAFIEDNGLQISSWAASVTYNPYKPNTDQYRESLRYAAEIGAKIVTVCGGFIPNQRRNTYPFDYDMFAGNLGKALAYAHKLGLEIAFHPHRGCVVETVAEARQMAKRLPDLKFCIDTAHLEASGEDAMKFITAFSKRIIATHIKDYSWKRDSFVEPGKGDGSLDVSACIAKLERAGYKGWYTIELDKHWDKFKQRPTPVQVGRQCRKFLRGCNL